MKRQQERLCQKYGKLDGSLWERLRYWTWAMYECPSEKTGQGNEGEITGVVVEMIDDAVSDILKAIR